MQQEEAQKTNDGTYESAGNLENGEMQNDLEGDERRT